MRGCRNSSSTSFTNAAAHRHAIERERKRERNSQIEPVIWVNNETLMKNNFTGVADLPRSLYPLPLTSALFLHPVLNTLVNSKIHPTSSGKLSFFFSLSLTHFSFQWTQMANLNLPVRSAGDLTWVTLHSRDSLQVSSDKLEWMLTREIERGFKEQA